LYPQKSTVLEAVDFNKLLCEVDHSHQKRAYLAALVIDNPDHLRHLFKKAFEVNDPLSSRACWVLEYTAKERLEYLLPYLDDFVPKLALFHLDSSIRPMAKICENLTESYFSKTVNETQNAVTEMHLELITVACFDWLIVPQKVAVQVYAMSTLWWTGQKFNWIHPELKLILERGSPLGSAAYKARARYILSKLVNKGKKG
jgi:hypothetical protein